MNDVYNLNMKDAEQASKILGKAFFNYPTFEYLFPNANIRKRNIVRVISFLLKCGIIHGEVLAPSNRLQGISVWYKSDNLNFPFRSVVKAGFFNLFFSMNPFTMSKFISLGNKKKRNRNSVLQGNYYFLDMIGIDPAQQSKGYAKLLIETKLKSIDQEHIACYLETSNIRNVDYYKKYGFHCIHEYSINGCKSFCMIRDPK
jgi:ribosomal protein S18 acetylase RimI-like enzyme